MYCEYCGYSYLERECPGKDINPDCEGVFRVCGCDFAKTYCDSCHCKECGESYADCLCYEGVSDG